MTPDDRIDAAELALGLLEGEARAAALEQMLADPSFATEVGWWSERLSRLLDQYGEAEPPAGLFERIAAERMEAGSSVPASAPVARPARRWPWLTGGAVGGALAASLAAAVLLPVRTPVQPEASVRGASRPEPLIAVLVPTEGQAGEPLAALVDRRNGTLRLTATIRVPRGRMAELWRIGDDKVPRAVGLLPRGSRAPTLIGGAVLPSRNEVLAISVEPEGGSSTGSPTGAVIATGSLVLI